jgi:1-acyl-sn-glycerol-3-phosphate acyltransferase
MIKAEQNRVARILFDFYIKRLMKKNFSNFFVSNDFPSLPENSGLIITPNHISWWDGFFIDLLMRKKSNRIIHLMMLESQLKRFWFFKKVGAFSINPDNPKSILESFNYTMDIATNPKNYAVIYPQGKIEPFEKRPLEIKKGISVLAKKISSSVYVLPVAFKIQYSDQKNPFVAVRFGKLLSGQSLINDDSLFEKEFYSNLDELNNSVYINSFNEDILKK